MPNLGPVAQAGAGALAKSLGLPFIPGANVAISLLTNKNFGIPKGMSLMDFFKIQKEYYDTTGKTANLNDPNWVSYLNNASGNAVTSTGSTGNTGSNMPFNNFNTATNNAGANNLLGIPGTGKNPDWLDNILKNLPPINVGGNNAAPGNNPAANNNTLNWLLPILAGISGGLENRSQETTGSITRGPSTETSNIGPSTTTIGPSTSTRTPNLDPTTLGYRNNLIDEFTKSINQDPDLRGYESNQLSNMGRTGAANEQQMRDELTSRGITGPALENALAGSRANSFSQTTQFRNQIPLLARDLRQQALTSAGQFFGTIPYGTTDTNSGRTDITSGRTDVVNRSGGTDTTSSKTSGNILGGGMNAFVAMLARLYGMGGFQTP